MSKDLQPIRNNQVPSCVDSLTLDIRGGKNNIYNNVGTVQNVYKTETYQIADWTELSKPHSYDYYNLFVVDDFSNGVILIPKELILRNKETDSSIIKLHSRLIEDSQKKLCMYPALVVCRNTSKDVVFGYLSAINILEDVVRVKCIPCKGIERSILKNLFEELGLLSVIASNELESVHWAVKHINLVSILEKVGIAVPRIVMGMQE